MARKRVGVLSEGERKEEAVDQVTACIPHEATHENPCDSECQWAQRLLRDAHSREVAEAEARVWRDAAAALTKSADGCGMKRKEHREAGKNATSTSIRKWRATEKRLRDTADVFTKRAESADKRARGAS